MLRSMKIDPVNSAILIATCMFPLLAIALGVIISYWTPYAGIWGIAIGGVGLLVGLIATYVVGWFRGGPVHYAARSGQHDWITVLAIQGWRMNCRNGKRETPFELACTNRNVACAKVLLDRGVKLSEPYDPGEEFWDSASDQLSEKECWELQQQLGLLSRAD